MSDENNNSRIPTKKRGRPKRDKPDPLRQMGMSKDQAIATKLIYTNMDADLGAELYELLKQGKTTMTVMQATARFPREQQRETFEKLQKMGARASKRLIEQHNKPASSAQIAASVWNFIRREFPASSAEQIAEGLEQARTVILATM